jgi:hypothetical protein
LNFPSSNRKDKREASRCEIQPKIESGNF